jgi:hypothetical protein
MSRVYSWLKDTRRYTVLSDFHEIFVCGVKQQSIIIFNKNPFVSNGGNDHKIDINTTNANKYLLGDSTLT